MVAQQAQPVPLELPDLRVLPAPLVPLDLKAPQARMEPTVLPVLLARRAQLARKDPPVPLDLMARLVLSVRQALPGRKVSSVRPVLLALPAHRPQRLPSL